MIKNKLKLFFNETTISTNWGLDHGAWSLLWDLIPKANIPVVMISLDYNLSFEQYFQVGKIFSDFRNEGVLILGSGNVVHSFKGINFNDTAPKNNDAIRFENYVKQNLREKNSHNLIHFDQEILSSAQFSINTSEHYILQLYLLKFIYAIN